MEHRDPTFERWIPQQKLDDVYEIENIGWCKDGFAVTLIPDNLEHEKRSKHTVRLVWEDVLCYQVAKETYRPDWWTSEPNGVWTFYASESSEYLNWFQKGNILMPGKTIHFAIVGTNLIVDILSSEYPTVTIVETGLVNL